MSHVSIDAATTLVERSVRKDEKRRIALWSSILIVTMLATIAFVTLISAASLTPEQRMALYSQSGTFP
jgi:type IV secretory pathway component VirB8